MGNFYLKLLETKHFNSSWTFSKSPWIVSYGLKKVGLRLVIYVIVTFSGRKSDKWMCCVLYTTHQERYVCFYFKYLEQFCILYQISWLNNGFWCFCWLHSEQRGLYMTWALQPTTPTRTPWTTCEFSDIIHYFYIGFQLFPFSFCLCRNRLGLYILEVYLYLAI